MNLLYRFKNLNRTNIFQQRTQNQNLAILCVLFSFSTLLLPLLHAEASPPQRSERALSRPKVVFTNVTRESGIRFKHHNGRTENRYLMETKGSGAAFFDYDNDGFLDLYVVDSGYLPGTTKKKSPGNVLYRNNGDGTFSDVTRVAGVGDTGYGMGVATADYDNDGDEDIYVTNFGPNVLYANNGDGTFTDVTQKAGVGDERWGMGCAFLDYDLDGDLDLYVVNYVEYDMSVRSWIDEKAHIAKYSHPRKFKGTADVLYQNNGDGTFSDVTKRAGVYNPAEGRGIGIAIGDLDNNGYPDVYVVNDTNRNFLYYNNGDGTFTDIALFSGTGYDKDGVAEGGMGVDIGDYNNDGWLDIIVANTEPNTLYKSHGDGSFTDESDAANLSRETNFLVGFSAKFLDYDNDGYLDIFFGNGHVQDRVKLLKEPLTYPQKDQIYRNNRDGTFTEVNKSVGSYFSEKHVGRGVAFGDYDNDGDTDIFIVNSGQPAILLRNDGGNKNNWIAVKLIGKKSNRDGIGSRITLTAGKQTQIADVRSGSSFLSSHDRRIIFGLGNVKRVARIEVKWPSGIVQVLEGVKANRLITITERE